jgi:hypothetical protein
VLLIKTSFAKIKYKFDWIFIFEKLLGKTWGQVVNKFINSALAGTRRCEGIFSPPAAW